MDSQEKLRLGCAGMKQVMLLLGTALTNQQTKKQMKLIGIDTKTSTVHVDDFVRHQANQATDALAPWIASRRRRMNLTASEATGLLTQHLQQLDSMFLEAVESAPGGAPPERSVVLRCIPPEVTLPLASLDPKQTACLGNEITNYGLCSCCKCEHVVDG